MQTLASGDGSDDIGTLRQSLLDYLKSAGSIHTPSAEDAFRNVSRHLFLPDVALDQVYRDQSVPTKRIDGQVVSSSSQPAIMATMLEQLDLKPGHRVLEIGAGTGYNAALMAHVVGNSGHIVTVDIDEDLTISARKHLSAAGFGRVRVVCGEGGLGYADAAPYDRIVLTVGAWDILPAWREQLAAGGRLLLPLEINRGVQKSIAFEPADDRMESVSVKDCGFMQLRGQFAGPVSVNIIQLGPEPGLNLHVDHRTVVNADAIYKLLMSPGRDQSTTVRVTTGEVIFGGLALWLSLREAGLCGLIAEGNTADRGVVPCIMEYSGEWKSCLTMGLLGDDSLCVFARSTGRAASPEQDDDGETIELNVRSYGPSPAVGQRLVDQVLAWDAAGRPSSEGLRVSAHPHDADYVPSANEFVVHKERTQLVLHWS